MTKDLHLLPVLLLREAVSHVNTAEQAASWVVAWKQDILL